MYGRYQEIMQHGGFERGISQFMNDLEIEVPVHPYIIDIGCGTGVVGATLCSLHPNAQIIFTDIRERFVLWALKKAKIAWFEMSSVGWLLDVNFPKEITLLTQEREKRVDSILQQDTFDIITLWAVLGYSQDIERSLTQIGWLLKPGGTLINLEMNGNIIARSVSRQYKYRRPPIEKILEITEAFGDSQVMHFNASHFPANLTRTGIVTKKRKIS